MISMHDSHAARAELEAAAAAEPLWADPAQPHRAPPPPPQPPSGASATSSGPAAGAAGGKPDGLAGAAAAAVRASEAALHAVSRRGSAARGRGAVDRLVRLMEATADLTGGGEPFLENADKAGREPGFAASRWWDGGVLLHVQSAAVWGSGASGPGLRRRP
jgi:hypothetical protein